MDVADCNDSPFDFVIDGCTYVNNTFVNLETSTWMWVYQREFIRASEIRACKIKGWYLSRNWFFLSDKYSIMDGIMKPALIFPKVCMWRLCCCKWQLMYIFPRPHVVIMTRFQFSVSHFIYKPCSFTAVEPGTACVATDDVTRLILCISSTY